MLATKLSWYVAKFFLELIHFLNVFSTRNNMFVRPLNSIAVINVQFNSNVFPHTSFNWVGIDGTQVLCHLTPSTTFHLMK